MEIYNSNKTKEFRAMDNTKIREIFHPKDTNLNLSYSLAIASLDAGEKSLPHILKESSEVYYILSGKAKMHIDVESEIVSEGDIIFIPPGANQWIENISQTTLKFLCVVSPPWKEQDEILK